MRRYGVRTIRLTGGEPLVRVGIEDLVALFEQELAPDLDITMTTNGVLLGKKAEALRRAGLRRVNVSLDTLHIDRFRDIARRDAFSKVLEGIRAAEEAGLWPIKLNVVVMKGQNDDEVVELRPPGAREGLRRAVHRVRALDGDNAWSNDLVVPSRRLQEAIEDQFPLQPVPAERPGPAASYRFADGAPGNVGFISSVSQAFCATCNRIRLTAEGGLGPASSRWGRRRCAI